jgi:hypothetical protein
MSWKSRGTIKAIHRIVAQIERCLKGPWLDVMDGRAVGRHRQQEDVSV